MVESYIAIDIETTGLNPKLDKIIEFGAIKYKNGQIIDEISMLINPRRELKLEIMQLTGINDQELDNAPDIKDVIGEILKFCEDMPILGHHVIFDFSFIKRAAVNEGLDFDHVGIDTLKLCRTFMPPDEKKTLQQACKYYQIDQGCAHRALADAYAAHYLYQELIRRYGMINSEVFAAYPLIYQVKKEQSASKRQKEYLHDLLKYHKIDVSVEIEYLTRNEMSRLTDQIISQHGKMIKR